MKSIRELMAKVRQAIPTVAVHLDEPANPIGEWFLDLVANGKGVVVQWREGGPFGLSSLGGEVGIGQKADELYPTLEATEQRLLQLLSTGVRTEPPTAVTLRELRAERNLSQTPLAELTGMHQPAVSRLELKGLSNMVVGTLLTVIQAMGGKLVMQAEFPDGTIKKLRLEDEELATARQ